MYLFIVLFLFQQEPMENGEDIVSDFCGKIVAIATQSNQLPFQITDNFFTS